MQTIEEAKAHCRDVGHDIEKAAADGVDLRECFDYYVETHSERRNQCRR